MATELPGLDVTFIAGASMTSSQYYLVEMSATNTVTVCNAVTDAAIGVLQNNPASGEAALVRVYGLSKVSSDEALTIGVPVGPSTDGQAQIVTEGSETTVHIIGRVVQTSGAAAGLATILLTHEGRAA